MKSKSQKQIVEDFAQSINKIITSEEKTIWNKINLIDFKYSDVEMLKIIIPKLCDEALEKIQDLNSAREKGNMIIQVINLLDFNSKLSLEKESEFLDSIILTKDCSEIETFLNEEESLLKLNGRETQMFFFENINYLNLDSLRTSISNVCKLALENIVYYDDDINQGTIMNYVGILLNFSSKLHFETEAEFLDDITEPKKKLTIENKILSKYTDIEKFEKPSGLFFLSDEDAVDPSEGKNLKNKVENA